MREIIKIRAEINEKETQKKKRHTKNQGNKINRPLVNLTKMKREKNPN
jgi:hypothetical protein